MNRIVRLISCCLLFATATAAVAQTETQAFYIYQHDGRMNGFFYDEVEKMTYSRFDTLGIEHDDYISQEIVTADSTYRIMLSAIDSIGFVQPEAKFNPRLRIYSQEGKYFDIRDRICRYVTAGVNHEENYIEFICWDVVPDSLMPKPGDIFANPSIDYGWAKKVKSVEIDGNSIYAYCEDIDDISDIFQQLIIVEEYGNDSNGNLVSRRVAGRPDLTIGQFPKKASEGKFEGDIFNFTLNGHFPFYNTETLKASADLTIKGGVHVRADWRLPVFGSKYIGVTTKLSMGVGVGFTVDGTLKEVKKGGIGQFAQIPLPATCPLLVLDLGPDGFIRGQADIKFSVASPMVGGSIWQKWEIIDWWPDCHWGFGDPYDDGKTPESSNNDASYKLELSGFVQTGLSFPLKVKSLPLISRLFDASLGGEWYIGPKVSGAIAVDLANFTTGLNSSMDTSAYDLLKGTSVTMSLCDADYEISAEVGSAFSEKKRWTFAEGTFSLLSPLEVKMVPDFGQCSDYFEERTIDGVKKLCHVLAFEPTGNVVKPTKVGVALFEHDDYFNYYYYTNRKERAALYYQAELLGEHEKNTWAEFVIQYTDGGTLWYNGKLKACPYVEIMGEQLLLASPIYEFDEGAVLEIINDTIRVDYTCETLQPAKCEGTCDELKPVRDDLYPNFPEWLDIKGKDGEFTTSVDHEKFFASYGKNYDPADTIKITKNNFRSLEYKGTRTVGGATGTSFGNSSDPNQYHSFFVKFLPNSQEDPVGASYSLYGQPYLAGESFILPTAGLNHTSTRNGNQGWHCTTTYDDSEESMTVEYDLVKADKTGYFYIQNGTIDYTKSYTKNGHSIVQKLSGTFGGSEDYKHKMQVNGVTGLISKCPLGSQYIDADITLSVTEDNKSPQTAYNDGGLKIEIYFADYLQ